MKVRIIDWAGSSSKSLEKLGYAHNQEITLDHLVLVSVLAEKFFNAGLNVMWLHQEAGAMALCIDSKSFQQN